VISGSSRESVVVVIVGLFVRWVIVAWRAT